MTGLGAATSISPGTYPNGPYPIAQSQTNLMNAQATLSQNPLNYSSPQYAIAAGLDPTAVNTAWAQSLAQYPTQVPFHYPSAFLPAGRDLVGEVVRRISGKSVGTYFRDEIAKPLGAEAYIGVGPEFDSRIAETIFAPEPKPGEQA